MLHNMDMYASVRLLSVEELCKVPVGCLILRDRHLKIYENKIIYGRLNGSFASTHPALTDFINFRKSSSTTLPDENS